MYVQKGHVYRCYDAANRLLYIGSTMNPVHARITSHRYNFRMTGKSAWVERMERTQVDTYPTWQEALVAEAALIAALDPPGNTQERRQNWSHSPAVDGYRAQVLANRAFGTTPEAAA